MNKKSLLFTFTFTLISFTAFCQHYKKEIEHQFIKYNTLIIAQDFEQSMNFVPEAFFAVIPKEQLVLLMEKTFNNPEVEFEMKGASNIQIADSEKIGDSFYSLMNYSSLINMRFHSEEGEEKIETEKQLQINLIKLSLEKSFGSENVKYNAETGFFEINAQKQAYAISKDGKTDWKFLVVEKNQKFILDKVLPKQLVDKI